MQARIVPSCLNLVFKFTHTIRQAMEDLAQPASPAKAGAPMWTAPCLQEAAQSFDRIACSHMSGLLVRSPLTAGRDGFRDASSEHGSGIGIPLGTTDCLAFWIDRSHHLRVLEQAAASADRELRFPAGPRLCRFGDRGGDAVGGIVMLAADHQLPGDAGHFIGQRHGGELGRFALQQFDKPRRGMAPCSLPGASFCRAAPAGSLRLHQPPARCARPRRRRG
jgi:hypothetical protein